MTPSLLPAGPDVLHMLDTSSLSVSSSLSLSLFCVVACCGFVFAWCTVCTPCMCCCVLVKSSTLLMDSKYGRIPSPGSTPGNER